MVLVGCHYDMFWVVSDKVNLQFIYLSIYLSQFISLSMFNILVLREYWIQMQISLCIRNITISSCLARTQANKTQE